MANKEYFLEAVAGNVSAHGQVIHKFGKNTAIGTTLSQVATGGIYRAPQPAGATKVRVKAGGNVNDAAGGTGARSITIQGINALGEYTTETIPTNGTGAGADSINTYIRIFRAFVAESGTYSTLLLGSHAAAIVIEKAAGSEDWITIPFTPIATGQSEVAAYTVPKGKNGYLISARIMTDSAKTTTAVFYHREGILRAAAPYLAFRKMFGSSTIKGEYSVDTVAPHGPIPELTDIGFMAKIVSGTAEVSAEFDILLRDKE